MSATNECMVCKAGLETRPVMREVRNGHQPTGAGATFQKRVHMKPAQLVITCRTEGSLNAKAMPDIGSWEVRLCVECLKGHSWSEVLAIALDRRLERGE